MIQLIRELAPFNHWFLERVLSVLTLILFLYFFIIDSTSITVIYLLKFVLFFHIYFGVKTMFKDYVPNVKIRIIYILLTQIILIKLFFLV